MTEEFKKELLERLWFHHPIDVDEQQAMVDIIKLIESGKDAFSRSEKTHITSRAFVFNKDLSKVLLHISNQVAGGYITTLGGHIEKDIDVYCIDAALREAKEESGKSDIKIHNDGKIFGVFKVELIQNGNSYICYDVIFSFIADSETYGNATEGTTKWYSFEEFKQFAKSKEKGIIIEPYFKKIVKSWELLKVKHNTKRE